MAKYSLETKFKAVNDVLELGMSAGAVAKSINTVKAVIQRWVARYEEYGVDGLSMKSGAYSGDFKVHVVEYMHENNMSIFRAAVHFGIPGDATVGRWERMYWEEGPQALYKDDRGRKHKMTKDGVKKPKTDKPVEEDLLSEVKRLRMENEYLKKLIALVQTREESAKRTK
jgi:transposase